MVYHWAEDHVIYTNAMLLILLGSLMHEVGGGGREERRKKWYNSHFKFVCGP